MIGKNTANWEMARLSDSSGNWAKAPAGQQYQLQPDHVLDRPEEIYRKLAAGEEIPATEYGTIIQQNLPGFEYHFSRAQSPEDAARIYEATQALAKEKLQAYDAIKQGWEQTPALSHEAAVLPPSRLPGMADYAKMYNVDVYDPEFERWWVARGPVGNQGGFNVDSPYHRIRAYAGQRKGTQVAQSRADDTASMWQQLIHATPSQVRGTPMQELLQTEYLQQGASPEVAAEQAAQVAQYYVDKNKNTRGQQSTSYLSHLRPQDLPGYALQAGMELPGAAMSAVVAPVAVGYGALTNDWRLARRTGKGIASPLTTPLGIDIGDARETALPTYISDTGRALRRDASRSDNTLYRYLGRLGGTAIEHAPTVVGSLLTAGATAPAAIQSAGRGLSGAAAQTAAAAGTAVRAPLAAATTASQGLRQLPQLAGQAAGRVAQQLRNVAPGLPRYTGVGNPTAYWNNIRAAANPAANNGIYQFGVTYPALSVAASLPQTLFNDAGLNAAPQRVTTWLENLAQNPDTNSHIRGAAAAIGQGLDAWDPFMPQNALLGLITGAPAAPKSLYKHKQQAMREQVRQYLLAQNPAVVPTEARIEEELRQQLADQRFDVDLNRMSQSELDALSQPPATSPAATTKNTTTGPVYGPAVHATPQADAAAAAQPAAAALPNLLNDGLTNEEIQVLVNNVNLRKQLLTADPTTRANFLAAMDENLIQQNRPSLSAQLSQVRDGRRGLFSSLYSNEAIRDKLQEQLKPAVPFSDEEIASLLALAP